MVATAEAQPRWAREYETIYVLRPNVDPDEAEKVASRISDAVSRLGGTLTKVDNWGKRKLAYNIQSHTRGIFIYLRYVGFSDLVAELERNLRMLDSVIRFQTVLIRDMVDPKSVQVDPDEVKFLRIEHTEDEEEPNLEQQLGFAPPAASEEGEEKRSRSDEEEEE
jgi:small subunit ribosomal protein S6